MVKRLKKEVTSCVHPTGLNQSQGPSTLAFNGKVRFGNFKAFRIDLEGLPIRQLFISCCYVDFVEE